MRVFVALNLPDAVRRALWDATTELRDGPYPIRWVQPEGLHLTPRQLPWQNCHWHRVEVEPKAGEFHRREVPRGRVVNPYGGVEGQVRTVRDHLRAAHAAP